MSESGNVWTHRISRRRWLGGAGVAARTADRREVIESLLAATRGDIKRHAARLKRFLESGRNIAAGGPGRMPPENS